MKGSRSLWFTALVLVQALPGTPVHAFSLVTPQSNATLVVPAGEPECVRLAVQDFVSDVYKITGQTLAVVPRWEDGGPNRVVVATVRVPDSSALLARVAPGVSEALQGRWESYRVESDGDQLVIAGSDERGTMFGLYALIESHLGVDPLYRWSSRAPAHRTSLSWDSIQLSSGEPTFKFRGWFINDEDLLTGWKESGGKRKLDYPYYADVVPREVMQAIAESLVRSRCNLIIPASFIDILNPPEEALVQECARRGVFISQHHVEPLGVSAFSFFNYWKQRGRELKYSYFSHPREVEEVWRAYAKKWSSYPNVIWQLGLRGIADRPMWMADPATPQSDADRGALISAAMAAQVKILDEVGAPAPRYQTATLWAEGSQLNEQKLLTLPKGTIVVFSDNSPGWKWQRDFFTTPRQPGYAYGVYYHHALIGSGPHLAQVPSPRKTHECLQLAASHGAASLVICNVSNIREFVLGIDATAKMTWNLADFDPERWLDQWIATRFSTEQATLARAYRSYFETWQVHPTQGVPFLMDGQMLQTGTSLLRQLTQRFQADSANPVSAVDSTHATPSPTDARQDAFWAGIRDLHPTSSRGSLIQGAGAQRAGFTRVQRLVDSVVARLPAEEARFLQDNLGFQTGLALQLSAWLEDVTLATEAAETGNLPVSREALARAEAALLQILTQAEEYCWGPWRHWYRGSTKLNLQGALQRTRDVRTLADTRLRVPHPQSSTTK
ncbi:MAG: glycosyl hydrolase 115 family protein [Opitutaceae bacterium]|nr:glycosyl hydrolase 115 family protein [Opitutaceae bacterium]